MLIRIREGELIPGGYRVAFFARNMNCAICAPICIHLVVRLARRVWEWSYLYSPSRLEHLLREAQALGYRKAQGDMGARIEAYINRPREGGDE